MQGTYVKTRCYFVVAMFAAHEFPTTLKIQNFDSAESFSKPFEKNSQKQIFQFLVENAIFSTMRTPQIRQHHVRSPKSRFWSKMPKLRRRLTRPERGLAGRSARFWKALDAQNRNFFGFGSIGPLPGELGPGEWGQILGAGEKRHFWSV